MSFERGNATYLTFKEAERKVSFDFSMGLYPDTAEEDLVFPVEERFWELTKFRMHFPQFK